jgi:hypothetical protein
MIKISDTTIFNLVVRSSRIFVYSMLWHPNGRELHSTLSSDPKINLNTTIISSSQEYLVVSNLYNLDSLTPYTIDLKKTQ